MAESETTQLQTCSISDDTSLQEAKARQHERKAKRTRELETRKALAIKALLDGKSKDDISRELSMRWHEVNRIEAELVARQQAGVLVHSYVEHRKKLLPRVLECGLNLIANGLKHQLDTGEPITLKDAEIVSRIVSNLDHIARLDVGDPTTIVDVNRTIPATLKDMVAALKRDPFIDTVQLAREITFDGQANGGTDTAADRQDNEEPAGA